VHRDFESSTLSGGVGLEGDNYYSKKKTCRKLVITCCLYDYDSVLLFTHHLSVRVNEPVLLLHHCTPYRCYQANLNLSPWCTSPHTSPYLKQGE
jgi:hypothetical protein